MNLNEIFRYNFQIYDDMILVCKNYHEKHENCKLECLSNQKILEIINFLLKKAKQNEEDAEKHKKLMKMFAMPLKDSYRDITELDQ